MLARLLLVTLLTAGALAQSRSYKHLAPRVGTKFFIRMNTKVNVVPYTAIFAYASGFRMNWDLRPTLASPPLPFAARADLHGSIAAALQRYGLEGRECVLRALCELAEIQSHSDIISNILRAVFKIWLGRKEKQVEPKGKRAKRTRKSDTGDTTDDESYLDEDDIVK